jgi:hypothetical protein
MNGYTQAEVELIEGLDILQEVRGFYEFRDVFGLVAKDAKIADKKEGAEMAQKYDIKAVHEYKDKDGNDKTSYVHCGWMFRFKNQEKDGYKIKIREFGRDI